MTNKGIMMTNKGETCELLSRSLTAPLSETEKYTVQADSEKGIISRPREGSLEVKSGSCYEFSCPGLFFAHSQAALRKSHELMVNNHSPFIQMTFLLGGNGSYYLNGEEEAFAEVQAQHHNLLYLPAGQISAAWQPCENGELFVINLSPALFFWYLPEQDPVYAPFIRSIKSNSPASLSMEQLPLTPCILSKLYEILHCKLKGNIKAVVIEAKVAELLNLQLKLCKNSSNCPEHSDLKREEVEKVQQARDIIISRLSTPPSLKELAHEVGTNEYYLKKHFKQVFGTTVFGYLHDYKMERSREMLAQGEIKIADIALELGYKHATHFTAAFKKHYGFLPHKIKTS